MQDEATIKKIRNNRMGDAMRDIEAIEEQLRTERSNHIRGSLLERLRRLKRIYSEHLAYPMPKIEKKKLLQFKERSINVEGVRNKVFVSNKSDATVEVGDCVEAVLENCSGTEFRHFECQQSVVLSRLRDCKVSCTARQVRIDSCENLEVLADAKTGICVEDSTGVRVRKMDGSAADVRDFSRPPDV
jgi:hypothetical protein